MGFRESQHLFKNRAENSLAFYAQKSSYHLGSVKLLCCVIVIFFRLVIFMCAIGKRRVTFTAELVGDCVQQIVFVEIRKEHN